MVPAGTLTLQVRDDNEGNVPKPAGCLDLVRISVGIPSAPCKDKSAVNAAELVDFVKRDHLALSVASLAVVSTKAKLVHEGLELAAGFGEDVDQAKPPCCRLKTGCSSGAIVMRLLVPQRPVLM